MKIDYVGGFWSLDHMALDYYYTASPGAEFTNYRLSVQSVNGAKILDPIKSATMDEDSDAADTFMNTVYSLFGFGPAGQTFLRCLQAGWHRAKDSPPVSYIDWTVFDTGTGDTNSFDAGPPYGVVSASVAFSEGGRRPRYCMDLDVHRVRFAVCRHRNPIRFYRGIGPTTCRRPFNHRRHSRRRGRLSFQGIAE